MSYIRQSFRSQQNLSDDTLKLVMSSWSKGTCKQYSPHISRWVAYCEAKSLDPYTADFGVGAEFLTQYFYSSPVDYSSFNAARSALSALLQPVNGLTFGNHPLIKRLLRGIFKERPSLPKYTVTYDVNMVFIFLKSLPALENRSLELPTKTTAILLCLLSGQRYQSLSALTLDHVFNDGTKYVFYIPTLMKQSRPRFHPASLRIYVIYNRSHVMSCETFGHVYKENKFSPKRKKIIS